jgi:D-glycero-D-manno-heptose 1,7-bisphosphate phosphatase
VRKDGLKNVSPQKFEDFKLVKGVVEVLQQAKFLGYLNIIVTNQPDIAHNKMSWDELNKMHDYLKSIVPSIEAVYVCPHNNSDNCHCRKPKPGMLFDAVKDYQLDLKKCFMIGDSQKDIDVAKNAGCSSILLETGYNKRVENANFFVKNLSEILKII